MFNADVLQKGLWACVIVLQAALVMRIVERSLLFSLRWFVAWLAAEVAFAILLIWTPISSVLYFRVWSVAQPALCILRIAAAWELVRRAVNSRLGKEFTRYHALAAAAVVCSLTLSAFSLRIERDFLHCSAWQYSVVLVNRGIWTSIAMVASAVSLIRCVRPRWPVDRNTFVHAGLLGALSYVEIGHYMAAASSHGRSTIVANIVTLILEGLLYGLWMVWLRPEEEAQAIGDEELPLAA
jgi:hypothetical protein